MSVKERIIAIKLIKKEKDNKKFFDDIGVLAIMKKTRKESNWLEQERIVRKDV